MRTPTIRFADDLRDWGVSVEDQGGRWVLARPESRGGLRILWRARMAWLVFTGRCDVLAWKAGQSKI